MTAPTHDAEAGVPLASGALVAAIAACAYLQGGYYPAGFRVAATLTFAALVLTPRLGRTSAWRVVPWLAFAGWVLWRAAAEGHLAGAAPWLGLVAVCGALWRAGAATPASRVDAMVTGLAGIAAAVGLTGWLGVVRHTEPWALVADGLWRSSSVITYANATAGFLVVALAALTSASTRPDRSRQVDRVLATLLWAGLGATLSRGGAVGLVVAMAVSAVGLGWRAWLRATVFPAIGGLVATVALVPTFPDDSRPNAFLAVAGLVAGVALATVGQDRLRGSIGRVALAMVGVAAVAGALAFSSGASAALTNRFDPAGQSIDDRNQINGAAWSYVRRQPLTGTGPEQGTLYWVAPDGVSYSDGYAHNEYLQTLVELGVPGLALVLLCMGERVQRLWVRRRSDPLVWGALASMAGLAAHSALDFLLHTPALPMLAAALGGLSLADE